MVQSDLSPPLPQGSGGVKLVDCKLSLACADMGDVPSADLKDVLSADAYGGSVIQNGLDGTGTAYPAADNQARVLARKLCSREERATR